MHHSTLNLIMPDRPRTAPARSFIAALILLATCCLTSICAAQTDPAQALPDASSLPAHRGIYIHSALRASEQLNLAQRMQRLNEWQKAADILMSLLEQSADSVIPSHLTEDGSIDQYIGLPTIIEQQLTTWPADALQTFNLIYGPQAAQLLKHIDPDDNQGLYNLYSRYFVTHAGAQAGLSLMDWYFEDGQFNAAAQIGQKLLTQHPNLDTLRPLIIYRMALALAFSAHPDQAMNYLDTLSHDHAQSDGIIAGTKQNLAKNLRDLLTRPPAPKPSTQPFAWPTFMGNNQRSGLATPACIPTKHSYSIALHPGDWSDGGNPRMNDFVKRADAAHQAGATLGVFPALYDNTLYFQDNARIYAISLETGTAPPQWQQTYPAHHGQYVTPGWGMPTGSSMDVSITHDSIFAILNQPDIVALSAGLLKNQNPSPRLVCLDRYSGTLQWSIDAGQLATAVPDRPRASLFFCSSPIVANRRVYIVAYDAANAQTTDYYLLCFDPSDGTPQWARYIAGALRPKNEQPQNATIHPADPTQLSYADGQLFVMTNIGVLAAINPIDGTVNWLNLYPYQQQTSLARLRQQSQRQPADNFDRPWELNPAIVTQGHLFILPAHSDSLLVYEATSGKEIAKIPRSDLGWAGTLIGVVDDTLVAASSTTAYCINWRGYSTSQVTDKNRETMRWTNSLNGTLTGRPILTQNSALIGRTSPATGWQILTIDLQSGMLRDIYPADHQKNNSTTPPPEPGNILITPSHTILSGSTQLQVYENTALTD